MTITVNMKNGEHKPGSDFNISDLFPSFNSELSQQIENIEIETPEVTFRVSTCFLLATQGGKWYANVKCRDGEFKSWNGTIYAGNVIYLNGKKAELSTEEKLNKYRAVIAARNELINQARSA